MEETSTKASAIQNISSIYSSLTEPCLLDFTNSTKILTAKRNTVLVKEGMHSKTLYFVIQGSARAFYFNDDKDITDWFAFENEFICSNNSFFEDMPSLHSIVLLEDTILLEMTRDAIDALADKYPDFDRLGRIVVTRTMLTLRKRIMSIQFETAQQKYESLLKIRPKILQRVALTHIASYLGITLETLSRIRNPKNRI